MKLKEAIPPKFSPESKAILDQLRKTADAFQDALVEDFTKAQEMLRKQGHTTLFDHGQLVRKKLMNVFFTFMSEVDASLDQNRR